jgi:hypothetical protein
MHEQEVLALKKHEVAEPSLYLQFSYSCLGYSHKSEQNSHFASCFSELWEVHPYITVFCPNLVLAFRYIKEMF